jgi:hypothetical protein
VVAIVEAIVVVALATLSTSSFPSAILVNVDKRFFTGFTEEMMSPSDSKVGVMRCPLLFFRCGENSTLSTSTPYMMIA